MALLTAQICALTRYVVLARLLGPEELGKAVIIVLAAQFFDLITDTASDRFLIQDVDGAKLDALRLVNLVSVARGIVIALVLIAAAHPIARFAGAPEIANSLKLLAVVPLITGFTNYEYRVRQREHDFSQEAAVLLSAEVLGLCATAAAAFALQDHRAILIGLSVKALAAVFTSQFVAKSSYGFSYPVGIAKRFWRFGAPLALNGLLLFIATQSDRVIISRWLGLDELGRYSVVLLLAFYPTAMIMRYVAALYLPKIAAARKRRDRGFGIADELGSTCLLLALIISVGFSLTTPFLLPLIFGERYGQDFLLIALVGLLMVWRLMEVPPTTIALATGQSRTVMLKNFCRLLSVPAALGGLTLIGGLPGIVTGLIAGEIVANMLATIIIYRKARWPVGAELVRYALLTGVGLALVVHAIALDNSLRLIAAGSLFTAFLFLLVPMITERKTIRNLGQVLGQTLRR